MAGTSAVGLDRLVRGWGARVFTAACDELQQAAARQPGVPRDTGALAAGIDVVDRRLSAPVFTAAVESTTEAGGVDYPEILEHVPFIAPRTARYLHFFTHGQEVFSKGFTNRHLGWWSKLPLQRMWSDAVRTGGARA